MINFISGINILKLVRENLSWIRRDNIISSAFILTLGQVFLTISGVSVNILLARILLPINYGKYGLVISILVWFEFILASGIWTAVQKGVSAKPERAKSLWNTALKLQSTITIVLFIFTILFAPYISSLLKDSQLTFLIRFAALDLLFFGYFRLGYGLQTGLHRFGRASIILGTYALVKIIAIPLLANSPLGLNGAIMGNTLATVVAVIVIFAFARHVGKREPNSHPREFKKFFFDVVPLSIFTICSMLLVSLDLWVLKYMNPPDKIIGLYVAAIMIPKGLIMLSGGRMSMMVSIVSRAKATGDYVSTKQSILKISGLFGSFIFAFALFVCIFSEFLIQVMFPYQYADAAIYLRVLIVGYAFFAIAEMLSSTLIALNKSWSISLLWFVVSLVSIPVYILAGKNMGPIGIAFSVVLLSIFVSFLLLCMIWYALADMRRKSFHQASSLVREFSS